MNKIRLKEKLNSQKGITGIDMVISIIIMALFVGLISGLISKTYSISIETQKSANANAYVTMILEKVDEKSYDEVTNNFITNLLQSGEIKIGSKAGVLPDEYEILKFEVSPISIDGEESNNVKNVAIQFKYYIDKKHTKSKIISMNKLKVREVYKNSN